MNQNHQLLTTLLSSAIRGQALPEITPGDFDWHTIYDEAKAHEVHTLIYPLVKNLPATLLPHPELMAEWERSVLAAGMQQIQHIQQISLVLDAFHKANIPVIALKGLVLRELYPHPDLRTMGDADLLVRRENFSQAKKLLRQLGYSVGESDAKHIHFIHRDHAAIELHQTLFSPVFIRNAASLEDKLWTNAVSTNILGAAVLTPDPACHLLYLCLHMAAHLVSGGFGLRQLCDFTLLLEAQGRHIDWQSLVAGQTDYSLERFIPVLCTACHILLQADIPPALQKPGITDSPYLQQFIDDMFCGGIYGKRNPNNHSNSSLLLYAHMEESNSPLRKLHYYLSILFPSREKLYGRYAYVGRHPLLLPVAWLHRIFRSILRKDLTVTQKAIYFTPSARSRVTDRVQMLEWLGLR